MFQFEGKCVALLFCLRERSTSERILECDCEFAGDGFPVDTRFKSLCAACGADKSRFLGYGRVSSPHLRLIVIFVDENGYGPEGKLAGSLPFPLHWYVYSVASHTLFTLQMPDTQVKTLILLNRMTVQMHLADYWRGSCASREKLGSCIPIRLVMGTAFH